MKTIDPQAPADRPETEQMKVIHRAMTREFTLLPAQVRRVGEGDSVRASVVSDHLTLLLGMLHEHHEAEDELLWPLLHQRVPMENALIEAMEGQHEALDAAIGTVKSLQLSWTRTAGAAAGEELAVALQQLADGLAEHLALEEQKVLPLIHDHLTVAEWEAPQKHAMKHGPSRLSDKLVLAGIVLEGATPRERAWFLGGMPAPARVLWRLMGARQYAEHQRLVRA
ncbi:hemerythrin domain-containing protein [Actinoplanes solisilvae]|uniref:hemerythrin domain-containing protein n=1 Tax=Actinoplanes solisilvae TaxID=2486853 RepID=UPI000FD729ED|nr:hemerythrin domain-containing protein [Actinoplanes solisilvae]